MLGAPELQPPNLELERVLRWPFAQGDTEAMHQMLNDAAVVKAVGTTATTGGSMGRPKRRRPDRRDEGVMARNRKHKSRRDDDE